MAIPNRTSAEANLVIRIETNASLSRLKLALDLLARLLVQQRYFQTKHSSAVRRVVECYGAAILRYDLLCDIKTQSGTSPLPRITGFGLRKLSENARSKFIRNARPAVSY